MTRSRESKRCNSAAPLTLVLLLGCGGAFAAAVDPGRSPRVPAGRRPDGVVIEVPAAVPAPVDRADASGVVSLRQPLRDDAVFVVVRAFVDGWQKGSLDALVGLLATDAGPIEARGRGRAALVEGWRQRLQAHPYARLAGAELVKRERVARWGWEELGAAGAPSRPPEMHPDEIYVRAPLEVTRVGAEKVFGDAMLLVLRPDGDKLEIAAYGEEEVP